MDLSYFSLSIDQYIAHLSFDIPQRANALPHNAWIEMKTVFDHVKNNSSVRVIVLSGNGKHFCAGIDIQTLLEQSQYDESCNARKREYLHSFIKTLQSCVSAIEQCNKPVIARIHGACIGGGVDIISACDLRYCTNDAHFSIKEIDLGIVADLGTLQRLPKIMPYSHVCDLAYTGRKINGTEAHQLGLVNSSFVDEEVLRNEVNNIALMISKKSPLVIRGIKKAMLHARDYPVEKGLDCIAQYNAAFMDSEDLMIALQAYITKSEPDYKKP